MINTDIIIKVLSIKGVYKKTALRLLKDIDPGISKDKDLIKFLLDYCYNNSPLKLDERCIIQGITKANNTLQECRKHNISFLDFQNTLYPHSLLHSELYPLILTYKGDISLLKSNCVTMIGTREPTQMGIDEGYAYGKLLAEKEFTIVSGLAIGCDTSSHLGCLAGKGKTIAILANSLDTVYPAKNKELATDILASGGLLLSELMIGAKLNAFSFLSRNHMQVGLSKCLIVIELKKKRNGTMYTVGLALKNNKQVGCLITRNEKREGNLRLIQNPLISPLHNQEEVIDFIKKNFPKSS